MPSYSIVRPLLVLVAVLFVSCSLDLPVEDEITGADTIDDLEIAQEALAGAYLSLPKNKVLFSKLSDDFLPLYHLKDEIDNYRLYEWNVAQIAIEAESLWNAYYATNARVNVLLQSLGNMPEQQGERAADLKAIKAQTLMLKAYIYYELLLLYAQPYRPQSVAADGIIMKEEVAASSLQRSSIEEVYLRIEALSQEAIALWEEVEAGAVQSFSLKSAYFLLAKVYLSWQKYEQSLSMVHEIIGDEQTASVTLSEASYNSVWRAQSQANAELVLGFAYDENYFTSLFNNASVGDYYAVNDKIVFEATDYRTEVTLLNTPFTNQDGSSSTVNFLGKYRTDPLVTVSTDVMRFRTAELYFVAAEAHYHLGRNEEARRAVNALLEARHSIDRVETEGQQLLIDILDQKQKEFVGEGVRYFDLKRNALSLDRLGYRDHDVVSTILPEDFRWVFPIPKAEINFNKKVTQNTGWEPYL